MRFRYVRPVVDQEELETEIEDLRKRYLVFPLVDPSSSGGSYMQSDQVVNTFNAQGGDRLAIIYPSANGELSYNDYKELLVTHLLADDNELRARLARPGLLIVVPTPFEVIFQTLRHTGQPECVTKFDVSSAIENVQTAILSGHPERLKYAHFSRVVLNAQLLISEISENPDKLVRLFRILFAGK